MSDGLKPCPFCGKPAKWSEGGHYVLCPNLNCANDAEILSAEWWNERPIEDAQAQRIARLERVLRAVDARLDADEHDEDWPCVYSLRGRTEAQIRRVIAAALR